MSFFCSVITLCLTLCDPMSCNMPGFPFLTISCSMLKLKSIESVILSNYLISSATPFFCLQSFPTLGFFSNESSLWIRWPKYWSFSFSNSPFNEYPGLISFIDWFDLLAVQGGHSLGRRARAGAVCGWECMLESSWQVNWSAGCLCSGPGSE